MTSRPALTLALVLTAALWAPQVRAQDALVRSSLSGDGAVWVGQRVTLSVELLVPGYFASAASFDIPDPDGVLLMPPLGHPVLGNETIDGTLYTVQRHQLAAWPMRAGEQTIPALTVRVGFKRNPLDRDAVAASVTTEPIRFAVALPPGAERLGTVISARGLDIDESWQPEPGADQVRAGAVFTRTVTFTAPDVPGMVFPPFPADAIDGLGVHARRQVLDHTDRGALTGVRRDVITYVCEQPGTFVIPAVRFTWFDLQAQQLRTERFQARTFTVIANPAMASARSAPGGAPAFDPRTLTPLAIALVVMLLAWTAWRNAAVRRRLVRWADLFRPVHLQPLNPTERRGREGSPGA